MSNDDSNQCPDCEDGKVVFNARLNGVECTNCFWNWELGEEKYYPPNITRRKTNELGIAIGELGEIKDQKERERWRRLIKINNFYRTRGNWDNRERRLEDAITRHTPLVLEVWDDRKGSYLPSIRKAQIALDIVDSVGLSRNTVGGILWKEDRWRSANSGMRYYLIAQVCAETLERLWMRHDGAEKVKEGNSFVLESLVEDIAEGLGLNSSLVQGALEYSGTWKTSRFACAKAKKFREYGSMISALIEGRLRAIGEEDEWELCELAEDISGSMGRIINPREIIQYLADSRQINTKSTFAWWIYNKYLYAQKTLELIIDSGPTTLQELQERFGSNRRNFSCIVSMLLDKGVVSSRTGSDRGEKVYYVESQEDWIKKNTQYGRLEAKLEEYESITAPEFAEISGLLTNSSISFLNRWVEEGRLVKESRFYPVLFAHPNGGSEEVAMRRAIRHRYGNILGRIPEEGTDTFDVLKERVDKKYVHPKNRCIGSGYTKCLVKKLKIFEDYKLVKEEDGHWYRGEFFDESQTEELVDSQFI